jgi:four helix bundle protein
MADFKKLDVFHKAHGLALATIRVSAGLRGYVGIGIRSQMVRAALSVPTNIVEGSTRASDREYARFINIAIGSLSELEYHFIVSNDLKMMKQSDFESLNGQLESVRKMLSSFHRRLKSSSKAAPAESR